MPHFEIVGAGLAGLLAANMLAHRDPIVHEVQESLPNNHSAVLRFRTSLVGDVTNIPFRQVTRLRYSLPWLNPVADALAYSHKNTGSWRSDRSITNSTNEIRWIAPQDFIPRLAKGINIKYGSRFNFHIKDNSWHPIISTIPMPELMLALDYPIRMGFSHVRGVNLRARIHNCDAYVSILVPDPELSFSRISITGNELIVECYQCTMEQAQSIMPKVAEILGIPQQYFHDFSFHVQDYAKINPIDDDARKAFMFWATDNFGIFSLGRYATWRPTLLLDDLVKDIRLINGWIETANRYSIARHR